MKRVNSDSQSWALPEYILPPLNGLKKTKKQKQIHSAWFLKRVVPRCRDLPMGTD